MTATAYADIRRRLAEATGPLDEADIVNIGTELSYWPTDHWVLLVSALRGSLDAAVALVDEKLPGWWGSVDFGNWGNNPSSASLGLGDGFAKSIGRGATPALAVLSALFAALEAAHD